jgi:phospholipase C
MRKLAMLAVVLFALLGTSVAYGQNYVPTVTFSHIIIIIQENRTPDNLFGSGPSQYAFPYGEPRKLLACLTSKGKNPTPFELGIDIDNGGPDNFPPPLAPYLCLTDVKNFSQGGGDHSHVPDWENQYDSGMLDGACYGSDTPPCPDSEQGYPTYPPYTYVDKSQAQPYIDIATDYGFANYMFQTSEGPSYPAHEFLFGGTSAPTSPGDSNGYYQYFVSENAAAYNGVTGCPIDLTNDPNYTYPMWANPLGFDVADQNQANEENGTVPNECYPRNTLATYVNSGNKVEDRFADNGLTWRYYSQKEGSIWTAPEADPQTCYTLTSQTGCSGVGIACGSTTPPCNGTLGNGGTEFSNVIFPGGTYSSAPILDDIQNCNLPSLSWVTPDEAWSDHPDNGMGNDYGYGPSWVADIVNAIGNSYANSVAGGGTVCDYWGYMDPSLNEQTAIFIVWDDWGGFYDHVPPPAVLAGEQLPGAGGYNCDDTVDSLYTYTWGCGYAFGFRVPLLVASAYTNPYGNVNTNGTAQGYVSGYVNSYPPAYPPPVEYTHDFGSILYFIEKNFKLGTIAPSGYGGYADQNSLDYNWCLQETNQGHNCIPLWDFFQQPSPQKFTAITPLSFRLNGQKMEENACFFQCYYNSNGPSSCNCPAGGYCNELMNSGCGGQGPDEGTDEN